MIEGYFGPQTELYWDQTPNRRPYKHDREENRSIGEKEEASTAEDYFRGKWDIHDSRLHEYDYTFKHVLPMPLKHLLILAAEGKPKPAILDLMASEAVVREAVALGFRYGLAVSLGMTHDDVPALNGAVVETVNKDLIEQLAWLEIKDRMALNGVPSFDVILCRPEGGLMHITNSQAIHFELLQRAWRMLSSDNGHLLFQIPFGTYHFAHNYFDELGKVPGLDVTCESPFNNQHGVSTHMLKTPLAPKILPTPKMLGMK